MNKLYKVVIIVIVSLLIVLLFPLILLVMSVLFLMALVQIISEFWVKELVNEESNEPAPNTIDHGEA